MENINIIVELSFFSSTEESLRYKKIYKTGLVTGFLIRKDMFNSGKITFLEQDHVYPGERNVKAGILFAYWDLVFPYLKKGIKFTFGEMSHPYGEGIVLEILKERET